MDYSKTKYEIINNFLVPGSNEKDMKISNLNYFNQKKEKKLFRFNIKISKIRTRISIIK